MSQNSPAASRLPVTAWTTDWDILHPHWVDDPVPIWDALRFSSRVIAVREQSPQERDRGGGPPITSDPPRHRLARMALLPPYTPEPVAKLGPLVLLAFPAANRDPSVFPEPDKVVIDRRQNRHAAFGPGIHLCLGSNLARMELKVAIEELLQRVPEFRLDGAVVWSSGTVRGPRRLPLAFG